jgi:leucyl aminopeptidase
VARDIGGGDPERMAPPRVADYIEALFKHSIISINVVRDQALLEKEYPLFGAVNRAASGEKLLLNTYPIPFLLK